MPIRLPQAQVPIPAISDREKVNALRRTKFRIDLLDMNEHLIRELDGVAPGGTLSWSASASVKASGTINHIDTGQKTDWLNSRLRPVITIANDAGEETEVPLGIFLISKPKTQWSTLGQQASIQLMGKLSILDTDIITNENGEAETYSLDKGTNIIDAVKAIIVDTGERTPAIDSDTEANLSSSQTWDVGTTRLQIINDLLSTANYFSLWCDGYGQFQTTKYERPSRRVPIYRMLTPFVDDGPTLMGTEWTHEEDIYSVPNRYWVQQQGTSEEEGLTAVATNEDPDSPYSYQARGRWITQGESGVEATSLDALEGYAQRKLDNATSTTSTIEIEHLYLPELLVNSVIAYSAGNVRDILTSVSNTKISLDPTSMVSTKLKRVVRNG